MLGIDLISSSMRLIGALASGEAPSGAEASDALMVLNDMLDSWNAERLTIFTTNISDFPLIPSKQAYTMGNGGDFNVPRPARLDSASIVYLNNPALPLELPIKLFTIEEWQGIPVKNIPSPLPQGIFDDGNNPLRGLSFWPIPTVANKVRLYYWAQLTAFDLNATDITFPPGYSEALRYNLAMRLIAEMPGDYNQIMVATAGALAVESLARIRSMNLETIKAHIDPALTGGQGHYNYYSDTLTGGKN